MNTIMVGWLDGCRVKFGFDKGIISRMFVQMDGWIDGCMVEWKDG